MRAGRAGPNRGDAQESINDAVTSFLRRTRRRDSMVEYGGAAGRHRRTHLPADEEVTFGPSSWGHDRPVDEGQDETVPKHDAISIEPQPGVRKPLRRARGATTKIAPESARLWGGVLRGEAAE